MKFTDSYVSKLEYPTIGLRLDTILGQTTEIPRKDNWYGSTTRSGKGLSPKLRPEWKGSYSVMINDVINRIQKGPQYTPKVVYLERLALYRGVGLEVLSNVGGFNLIELADFIAQLSNKCIFSVLDLSSGFWQLELDIESSKLTTFMTPFGRFKFKRVPFGINCAPEIFQRKMVETFGDIPGVIVYFDDNCIIAENLIDHDKI